MCSSSSSSSSSIRVRVSLLGCVWVHLLNPGVFQLMRQQPGTSYVTSRVRQPIDRTTVLTHACTSLFVLARSLLSG
jgi:hypothetical protein